MKMPYFMKESGNIRKSVESRMKSTRNKSNTFYNTFTTGKMLDSNYPEKSFLHFSFLRDIKVNGVYYNSLPDYLDLYSFLRNRHYHDFYSVILLIKGDGSIKITNDDYPVYPQTLYLIAPNQMHSFENLKATEGQVFFFCQDFYVEEFSYIRLLDVFSCALKMNGNVYNQYLTLSSEEYGQVGGLFTSIGQACGEDVVALVSHFQPEA